MSARKLSKLDTIRVRVADWHILGHELSSQVREEPKLLSEICSTCLHDRGACTCPDMVRVSKRTLAIQHILKLATELDENCPQSQPIAGEILALAREALGA